MIGDSHVKNLSRDIYSYLNVTNSHIYSVIFPNASLHNIITECDHLFRRVNKNDFIIILTGLTDTNPTSTTTLQKFTQDLDFISNLGKRTNVIMCYIPRRYDIWEGQIRVQLLNNLIKSTSNIFKYLTPEQRYYYNYRGLYYTNLGKCVIGRDLAFLIKEFSQTREKNKRVRTDVAVVQRPGVAHTSQLNKRYYIEATVGGLPMTVLLDQGCSATIIKSSYWYELQKKGIHLRPISSNARMANGSLSEIVGVAKIPINIGKQTWTGDCYLVKHLAFDAIIGINTLKELRAIIDFGYGTLTIGNTTMLETLPVIELAATEPTEENNQEILCKISSDIATKDKQKVFADFLNEWINHFKLCPGKTDVITHKIYLNDNNMPPIKQRYYNYSPATQAIIQEKVDKLLRKGIIEPSDSPWSSPLVVVKKKDGSNRLCVDFRKLNSVTRKNGFPLPHIHQILDQLKDAKYVTSLDLVSGFNQIAMDPDSKPLTAFSLNNAHFQYVRMPFGLHSAPSTFQACMNKVLSPVLYKSAWVYLDDVLIASPSFDKHIQHVRQVFQLLFDAGLTINWKKSFFLRSHTEYLGFVIGGGQIRVSRSKVEAIENFPRPLNVKQLRGFLGLSGWYRRFVDNYATKAACLTKLLHKDVKYVWTQEQENAFNLLKQDLIRAPLLYCPNFDKTFTIQCDASDVGVGGLISQVGDSGEERVVAFTSRTLSRAERSYTTTEKELLAIIHSVETFRPYIENTHFKIITDHQCLKWLHNIALPNNRLARWITRLAQYDFEIIHRKGKFMTVVDALSRTPYSLEMAAILPNELPNFQNVSDPWYRSLIEKVKLDPISYSDFHVEGKYLFKNMFDENLNTTVPKLYVPYDYRLQLIQQNHQTMTSGHLGIKKTYEKLSRQYFWPSMWLEVKEYVNCCTECQQYKTVNQKPCGHMNVKPPNLSPGKIWSIDFVGPLPRSKRGNQYIFVAEDTCTKFLVAVPTRNITSQIAVRCIVDNVILEHGCPSILLADNGSVFTSKLFKDTCKEFNVKLHHTPVYCPQVNEVERYNKNLKTCLSIFARESHQDWDVNLRYILFALRTTPSETTGYSPAFLTFGRELKSPFELFNPVQNSTVGGFNPENYVDTSKERLAFVYKKLKLTVEKAKTRQAHQYNLRHQDKKFAIGDLVMKRNFPKSSSIDKISAKLCPKYLGFYKISEILGDDQYLISDLQGNPCGRHSSINLKSARYPIELND